ncbi:MAG: hypothetical protein CVU63_00040 [Deltaproteobacteria bacterium HGW-Deltaproteobacteria-20]|jgi:hypothetical protein|nr:MAG: hypothetical protein CVU63_00040 [Deltaproteobacteria bacterium HGW-Deltaproteobacteria-20]
MNRNLIGRVVPLALVLLAGCPSAKKEPAGPTASQSAFRTAPRVGPTENVVAAVVSASAGPAEQVIPPLDLTQYPWHADTTLDALAVHDDLLRRVATPEGFVRVSLEEGSFGAWLRRLPLAAPGTPVLSNAGRTILPGDHPHLTAVSTLDIGKGDLQQCADAVMRLHGEWVWSKGKRDMSYRAASGTDMPYARWERGERVVQRGQSIAWAPGGGPSKDDHASFRKYMDAVFAWSNTVALARQAAVVAIEQIQPGDFLILPGNPGHTVLVLDLAKDAEGKQVALLGQSYMPAQSFHVLRPRRDATWFTIDPAAGGVQTPFWPKPFPWSSLRRL